MAGAIRRRGGPAVQEECDQIGGCPAGEAVVTGAGSLPARWVIHAVGPVWQGGQAGEERLLGSAVRAALWKAEGVGAKSVALPAISTGAFGFPLEHAAEISVGEAKRFAARAKTVERVVFCLFDERTYRAFEKAMDQ